MYVQSNVTSKNLSPTNVQWGVRPSAPICRPVLRQSQYIILCWDAPEPSLSKLQRQFPHKFSTTFHTTIKHIYKQNKDELLVNWWHWSRKSHVNSSNLCSCTLQWVVNYCPHISQCCDYCQLWVVSYSHMSWTILSKYFALDYLLTYDHLLKLFPITVNPVAATALLLTSSSCWC